MPVIHIKQRRGIDAWNGHMTMKEMCWQGTSTFFFAFVLR